MKHVERLGELPLHHTDPFDRMLVAQGIEENMPLVTSDEKITGYPLETIW